MVLDAALLNTQHYNFELLLARYYPILSLVGRVFANDQVLIPGRVIPKTQKIVLDNFLLNTLHYKLLIKGKMEQSRERNSALPYISV